MTRNARNSGVTRTAHAKPYVSVLAHHAAWVIERLVPGSKTCVAPHFHERTAESVRIVIETDAKTNIDGLLRYATKGVIRSIDADRAAGDAGGLRWMLIRAEPGTLEYVSSLYAFGVMGEPLSGMAAAMGAEVRLDGLYWEGSRRSTRFADLLRLTGLPERLTPYKGPEGLVEAIERSLIAGCLSVAPKDFLPLDPDRRDESGACAMITCNGCTTRADWRSWVIESLGIEEKTAQITIFRNPMGSVTHKRD